MLDILPVKVEGWGMKLCSDAFASTGTLCIIDSNDLNYWGIYKVLEELAELAGVEDCHPHRLRHTFATKLVLGGMDTMLARQLTRHKSESSFDRCSKRALEIQAQEQFYAVFGEEGVEKKTLMLLKA